MSQPFCTAPDSFSSWICPTVFPRIHEILAVINSRIFVPDIFQFLSLQYKFYMNQKILHFLPRQYRLFEFLLTICSGYTRKHFIRFTAEPAKTPLLWKNATNIVSSTAGNIFVNFSYVVKPQNFTLGTEVHTS